MKQEIIPTIESMKINRSYNILVSLLIFFGCGLIPDLGRPNWGGGSHFGEFGNKMCYTRYKDRNNKNGEWVARKEPETQEYCAIGKQHLPNFLFDKSLNYEPCNSCDEYMMKFGLKRTPSEFFYKKNGCIKNSFGIWIC